jgi:hypothetical protein
MARRSFQLTPEQAKLPEKQPSWLDRFAERILPGVPAIKAATIAVALLLVSITAFDVLTNQSAIDDQGSDTSVMREAGAPAEPEENAQPAATEAPLLGEAGDSAADGGGLGAGGAEQDAPLDESADDGSGDAESADESFTSSAMQEAPPAPAAAVQQATEIASPTPEPTATATATPLPSPTSTVTATATPADSSDGWSAGFTVSWWRLAELGLLLLLIWLIVSWFGRSRVESLDD